MGWAIGFSPVHGDGILISDMQVVFTLMEKEPYEDCLQKIHYVGPNILCAFTGSVKIGFRIVAEMKKQLGSARKDQGWNIDEISKLWIPRLFRHIYENAEDNEKVLGLDVILVAAHPNKVHGGSTLPWIDAVNFRFPDFQSEKSFMNQPILIGNHSTIQQRIGELCRKQFSIQTQPEDPVAQAALISDIIRGHVEQQSANRISPAFQVGLINRGSSVITGSDEAKAIQTYGNFAKFCAERKLEPFCALA